MLDVAERGRAQRQDGRAYLCVGDYLDAEDVGEAWTTIIAEGAKYEVLALLVEDEDARKHGADDLAARAAWVVSGRGWGVASWELRGVGIRWATSWEANMTAERASSHYLLMTPIRDKSCGKV